MLRKLYPQYEYKGICPICDREMYDGQKSIDKHHFVPKCKGGRITELVHVICHRKIHSLFSEAECAKEYSDPELVRQHPEMAKFIKWVAKKDPLYNDHHEQHKDKGRRR